jgi:hypothetical protein
VFDHQQIHGLVWVTGWNEPAIVVDVHWVKTATVFKEDEPARLCVAVPINVFDFVNRVGLDGVFECFHFFSPIYPVTLTV